MVEMLISQGRTERWWCYYTAFAILLECYTNQVVQFGITSIELKPRVLCVSKNLIGGIIEFNGLLTILNT